MMNPTTSRRLDAPSSCTMRRGIWSHRNSLLVLACNFLLSSSPSSNNDKRSGSVFFGVGVHTVAAAQGGYHQQGYGHQQGGQSQQGRDENGYYGALNLSSNASAKDIKSAYRKLALKFHPDKFKEDPGASDSRNKKRREQHNERFVKISAAYDVLSDDKKRKAYDRFGQKGLDMLERGIDPEEAGFGGGGFGGAGYNPYQGFGGFNQQDAFKMFENAFGGSGGFPGGMPNMGGMGGMPNFDGIPGGIPGMDYEQMYREAMKNGMGGMGGMGGMPNMGGFNMGGMPNMGGFNMGGFPGYGGGQQQHHQQQQQQQQRQRRQQQRQKPPEPPKEDSSGVVPLGQKKFPDGRSKHPWVMLFYDKDSYDDNEATPRYVTLAKELSLGVMKKAKNNKNAMVFKVGAVDCSSGEKTRFCMNKLGQGIELPVFAFVMNGRVEVVKDTVALRTAKHLHDHMTSALVKTEGLVINVNSKQHIESRLLSSSPAPGQKTVAILLLTDKYETSALYASLAYRHRHSGFTGFGESRGSNQVLGKEYNVKKYPKLLALIGRNKVEEYGGNMDMESISSWLSSLSRKHFKLRA